MSRELPTMYSDQIKGVYEALADVVSKQIFILRLNYFLTWDIGYLQEMAYVAHRADNRGRQIIQDLFDNHELCKNGVVFYGAGVYARQLVETFKNNRVKVMCFCDSSPEKYGEKRYGLSIISPVELMQGYDEDIPVVISSDHYQEEIYKQLVGLGVREERIYCPTVEQYFGENFLRPVEDEIYIDAGVFDGLSIDRFISFCGGGNKKIYGFEPAQKNVRLIKETTNLSSAENVYIIPKGVYSEVATLRFSVEAVGSGSSITADGDEVIETVTIDEVVNDEAVTLIKMDIKGAELQALMARRTRLSETPPDWRYAYIISRRIF